MPVRGGENVEIIFLTILLAAIVVFDYVVIHCGERQPGIPKLAVVLRPRGWKQLLYYILVPLSCAGIMLMLWLFYGRDAVFVAKRLLVAGVLWPVAVFDYREFRIPNKLLLLALGARAAVMIFELLLYGKDALSTLAVESIAAVGCVVICVICMLISQGSLGMGDLKLMAVVACFLGIEGTCYAMFMSVLVAFICSVTLLITKKKGRKDAIPFAPFILIGTIVSFILSGT